MSEIIIKLRRFTYLFFSSIDKMLGVQNNIIVLTYHNISQDKNFYNVTKTSFEAQMNHLLRSRRPVTLTDLNNFLAGRKKIVGSSFVLTFDDGYKEILNIQEFLKIKKIKPAFFVLSNPNNVNRDEIANQGDFLSTSDTKSLIDSGWEIGCHGGTHSNLASLNEKQLTQEIIVSKNTLEFSLNKKIKYFAYPKGKYSNQIIKQVKKAGYELAFSMDDEIIIPSISRYKVPRIGVNGSHSLSEFATLPSPSVVKFRKFVKKTFGSLCEKYSFFTNEKVLRGKWRTLHRT